MFAPHLLSLKHPIEPYKFWATPVPNQAKRRATTGYAKILIDTTDPRYHEPLVNLKDYGIKSSSVYYGSRRSAKNPQNPPYNQRFSHSIPYVWVRKSVAEALQKVDRYLRKHGMRLVATDGYRRPELQQFLHDVFWPEEFRKKFPGITDAEIAAKLQGFIAPARTDPLMPSPHFTGGAVDLTIERIGEGLLDMGTAIEEPGQLSFIDAYEPKNWRRMRRTGTNLEVIHNRRLLFWLMIAGGFHVHTDEWWHFMFGDQMWAQQEGFGKEELVPAFYSLAEPPPELIASCAT